MKPLYARVETPYGTRKVMLDMAYISTNKKIRLPKYYLEEGLFLPYLPDKNEKSKIDKFPFTREKAFREDENFYYFDFPFKHQQVEDIAV